VNTVLGRLGCGALVSAVERKSRYLALGVVKKKTAVEMEEAIYLALEGQVIKTLTVDNGSEFANFKSIKKRLGNPVFFANPHNPWQRVTNENVNRLIRWFLPKGCDFRKVNQQKILEVENIINNRPRKCLAWLTPKEVLNMCCT